jgi:hypothetical protein
VVGHCTDRVTTPDASSNESGPAPADDASEFECGAGDGCGWTPDLLPGLALWLDAGLGVSVEGDGTVSSWRDRSGRDNHAVADGALLRPVSVAGPNGRPMIAFRSPEGADGVHLRVRDAPTLRWGSDPFLLVVVGLSTNEAPSPGLLFRKRGLEPTANGLELMAEGPGDGRLQASLRPDRAPYETIAQHLTNGRPFAFAVRRTGTNLLELRVNGHADGRVPGAMVSDISGPGADVLLGAGADPPCCQLTGGIAEVIAVAGELSDDDLARVESYLRNKYGLP